MTNNRRLAASAIFVLFVAALSHEFFAERYGTLSFDIHVPGGQIIACLAVIICIAAMFMVLSFIHSLINKRRCINGTGKAESTAHARVSPYSFAWLFGVVFGPRIAGYSVLSLAIVFGALLRSRQYFHPSRSSRELRWPLRTCVGLSLVGFAFSDRAP